MFSSPNLNMGPFLLHVILVLFFITCLNVSFMDARTTTATITTNVKATSKTATKAMVTKAGPKMAVTTTAFTSAQTLKSATSTTVYDDLDPSSTKPMSKFDDTSTLDPLPVGPVPEPPTARNMTPEDIGNEDLSEEIEKLRTSGYLFFPHIYRAFIDAGKNPADYNISQLCGNNLARYYKALNDRKGWAWNMYDSTGKQGAGLFTGALTWTGNYQQCLNTLGYYSWLSGFSSGDGVPAQFCSVYIATPSWVKELIRGFNLPFPVPMPTFIGDVCTVQGCSEADLHRLVQQFVDKESWRENLTVTAVRCQRERNVFQDVPAIISLCIIFVLLLLVAMGTTYDIILRARRSGIRSSRDIPIGEKSKASGRYWYFTTTESDGVKGPTLTGYVYKNNAFTSDGGPELKASYSDDNLDKENRITDKLNQEGSDFTSQIPSTPSSPLKTPTDDIHVVIEQSYGTFFKSTTEQVPGIPNGRQSEQRDNISGLESATGSESLATEESSKLQEAVTVSESSTKPKPESIALSDSFSVSTSLAEESESVATPVSRTVSEPESTTTTTVSEFVTSSDSVQTNAVSNNGASSGRLSPPASPDLPDDTSISSSSFIRNRNLDRVRASEDGGSGRRFFKSSQKNFGLNRSLKKSDSFPRMQRRHLKTQLSMIAFEKSTPSTVNLFQRILVSFSFRRNLGNILGKGHADTMFCLNGVRVLSIGWIVLGSYYSALYSNPSIVDNHVDAVKLTQSFWIQPFINTTFAADTFFVLSGTLYAYNFMKLKSKNKSKKMHKVLSLSEYVASVIHRLARIVPCYFLVIMVYTNLGRYMNVGLELRHGTKSSTQCSDHWWANALFISNFYKADKMCMPWTYYLVNDFQFSLLSPLVVIPLLCYPALGLALILGLIVVQIFSVMIINTGINGNVMRMSNTNYFSKVYVKPYCRVGAYAVGLGLGYLLFTGERKIRLRDVPLYIGWLLCLGVVVTLPYITYLENQPGGRRWSGVETSLYEALSRPIWALAVAWVIFTCCNGQGGFISKFLSWNFFIPLCRITYGVYLVHPILIEAVIESNHNNFFVTFGELTYGYISNFICCWCLALVFITVVEQPFVQIESIVRKHLHAKRS